MCKLAFEKIIRVEVSFYCTISCMKHTYLYLKEFLQKRVAPDEATFINMLTALSAIIPLVLYSLLFISRLVPTVPHLQVLQCPDCLTTLHCLVCHHLVLLEPPLRESLASALYRQRERENFKIYTVSYKTIEITIYD